MRSMVWRVLLFFNVEAYVNGLESSSFLVSNHNVSGLESSYFLVSNHEVIGLESRVFFCFFFNVDL